MCLEETLRLLWYAGNSNYQYRSSDLPKTLPISREVSPESLHPPTVRALVAEHTLVRQGLGQSGQLGVPAQLHHVPGTGLGVACSIVALYHTTQSMYLKKLVDAPYVHFVGSMVLANQETTASGGQTRNIGRAWRSRI